MVPGFGSMDEQRTAAAQVVTALGNEHREEQTPPPPNFVAAEDLFEETPITDSEIEQMAGNAANEEIMEATQNPTVAPSVDEIETTETTVTTPEETEKKMIRVSVPGEENNESKVSDNRGNKPLMTLEDAMSAKPVIDMGKIGMRKLNLNRGEENENADGIFYARPFDSCLRMLIFTYGKESAIYEDLTINLIPIGDGADHGLWNEGGSSKFAGHVLLVCGPDLQPTTAVQVTIGYRTVNGKNSLVKVDEGWYVLMGGWHKNKHIVAIYRINEINPPEPNSDQAVAELRLVTYFISNKANQAWDRKVQNKEYGEQFTLETPFVEAGMRQLYTVNVRTPVFIHEFKDFYTDNVAYNKAINMWLEEHQDIEVAPDYPTMMEKAIKVAKDDIWKLQKGHRSVLYTFIQTIQGGLLCTQLVMIYDWTNKIVLSVDFVQKTFIPSGTNVFHYPGEDEIMPTDAMFNAVTRMGGSSLAAQRCLVPDQPESSGE